MLISASADGRVTQWSIRKGFEFLGISFSNIIYLSHVLSLYTCVLSIYSHVLSLYSCVLSIYSHVLSLYSCVLSLYSHVLPLYSCYFNILTIFLLYTQGVF